MAANPFHTHEVTNQSQPYADANLFTSDVSLRDAVTREGGAEASAGLTEFGALTGSADALEQGRLANVNPPKLKVVDRFGNRIDQIEFHPAYHVCMATSCAQGLHFTPWEAAIANVAKGRLTSSTAGGGLHVVRAAGTYMAAQMEAGHGCPITMTHAAVPTLLLQPDIAQPWLEKIAVRAYDHADVPMTEKAAVTFGMGMTEKQGGSDVQQIATQAAPIAGGGPGREYILVGHKWFLSAPMSDAFLVLAQAPRGLTCFLMPRLLPDGTRNAIRFQRLKDKLGNRSNASVEAEFHGAHAFAIGEEGGGVPAILEMVTCTRLDCAIASAGHMRFALANAIHHARHRRAFQKLLIDQPLMSQVLADMALDVEAATALSLRLARSFDQMEDPIEAAWRRLMTPVTKYWVCKIAPTFAYEAMECLGGNGYVEDAPLARLYRDVPVNAIWEGSGNIMCLDVMRVLLREPALAETVVNSLEDAADGDQALTAHLQRVLAILHEPSRIEMRARELIEGLALAAAGSLLRVYAPPAVADAFIATRLEGHFRQTYGQGLDKADTKFILERALPAA